MIALRIKIDTRDRTREWYHEWYDPSERQWRLELAYEKTEEDTKYYYHKKPLLEGGHLADPENEPTVKELRDEDILPVRVDDTMTEGEENGNKLFSISFESGADFLAKYENEWLPIPYFSRSGRRRFNFGPLNWSRMKLIPINRGEDGVTTFDVLLAFDTRTQDKPEAEPEYPLFDDPYADSIQLALCKDELLLADYCSPGQPWSFVDRRLWELAYPELPNQGALKNGNRPKTTYVAFYIFLMNYLAKKSMLPEITLYRNRGDYIDVDMVVDIGNSRTTALLIEDPDKASFNKVRPLALTNFTDPIISTPDKDPVLRLHNEPFDMRLAFRRVNFGHFGPGHSRQFVHPGPVRLGIEANTLLRKAGQVVSPDSSSTFSSPKRYLWDGRKNREEWRFLILPGEPDEPELYIPGITSQLRSDGTYSPDNAGDVGYTYSPRSLMTLAFIEMLAHARSQINSVAYRSPQTGFGYPEKPRRLKRIIVTCPTAMTKLERDALADCARDAVKILGAFDGQNSGLAKVQIVPSKLSADSPTKWYYDEATCSQLVYIYGEIGYKYRGNAKEFFTLYGKPGKDGGKPSLTIGSLDIGAGTSDLMISRYTYEKGDVTTIVPDPLFYDSFYIAGDDILKVMVQNIMLQNPESAFRQALKNMTESDYLQLMRNFFGPDHNDQNYKDRILRRDFNMQYSVPLMTYFLELLSTGAADTTVTYTDVFGSLEPNPAVVEGFLEHTGIDIRRLEWRFKSAEVSTIIEKGIEPLLKKIATVMFAYGCDIILLSGRPASIPVIRDIFLKFYAVAPDRLIVLNNYYVGHWYPFGNNTGYITNPKTIVAMGGIIGHYASELARLNRFVIDKSRLDEGLKSTVKFIEAESDRNQGTPFLSENETSGNLTVSYLPLGLDVRQINMKSYPPRSLYVIDFNRHKISDRIKKRIFNLTGSMPDNYTLQEEAKNEFDRLRNRMPFTITIERSIEDPEQLEVTRIIDRNGEEVIESNIEVHVRSLGSEERYWLDTGEFNF